MDEVKKSDWQVLADFRATLSRFGMLPIWQMDSLIDLVMWTEILRNKNEAKRKC